MNEAERIAQLEQRIKLLQDALVQVSREKSDLSGQLWLAESRLKLVSKCLTWDGGKVPRTGQNSPEYLKAIGIFLTEDK